MNKLVLETLFYLFISGALDAGGKRALFLNAEDCAGLADFDAALCYQPFKPYADRLTARGFAMVAEDDFPAGVDVCLVAVPKNMVEARWMIARGLQALRAGGVLVAAADNKAGGGRLLKLLKEFGVAGVMSESRNKCRVVWADIDAFDGVAVAEALACGAVQPVLDGAYMSQPGVFGWNKIDAGSALLVEHFPDEFSGHGADFGCGYGYLSRAVMARGPKVKALHAIDADARAVELCAQNVEGVNGLWADIVDGNGLPVEIKGRLDFIVMNPPFHEGKATDAGIGSGFLERAALALKKKGVLWVVANAHLPYERALDAHFFSHERLAQQNGFKVFRAVK